MPEVHNSAPPAPAKPTNLAEARAEYNHLYRDRLKRELLARLKLSHLGQKKLEKIERAQKADFQAFLDGRYPDLAEQQARLDAAEDERRLEAKRARRRAQVAANARNFRARQRAKQEALKAPEAA